MLCTRATEDADMRRSGGLNDAKSAADQEHGDEDHARDRAALAKSVGDRHCGYGEEECDDHSHAAGSLSSQGDARFAQEVVYGHRSVFG